MDDFKNVSPGRDTLDEKHEHGDVELQPENGTLTRALKGRHMQMIAMGTCSKHNFQPHSGIDIEFYTGGSIGAGLFVGSGGAFRTGGPASVVSSSLETGRLFLRD